MIAKFILLVVFAHGYGPRTNYAVLGEYITIESCRTAANAVIAEHKNLGLIGDGAPRLICAAK